jgi:hypothetical protein
MQDNKCITGTGSPVSNTFAQYCNVLEIWHDAEPAVSPSGFSARCRQRSAQ